MRKKETKYVEAGNSTELEQVLCESDLPENRLAIDSPQHLKSYGPNLLSLPKESLSVLRHIFNDGTLGQYAIEQDSPPAFIFGGWLQIAPTHSYRIFGESGQSFKVRRVNHPKELRVIGARFMEAESIQYRKNRKD